MGYRSYLSADLERIEEMTSSAWAAACQDHIGDATEMICNQLASIYDALRTIDEIAAAFSP